MSYLGESILYSTDCELLVNFYCTSHRALSSGEVLLSSSTSRVLMPTYPTWVRGGSHGFSPIDHCPIYHCLFGRIMMFVNFIDAASSFSDYLCAGVVFTLFTINVSLL